MPRVVSVGPGLLGGRSGSCKGDSAMRLSAAVPMFTVTSRTPRLVITVTMTVVVRGDRTVPADEPDRTRGPGPGEWR